MTSHLSFGREQYNLDRARHGNEPRSHGEHRGKHTEKIETIASVFFLRALRDSVVRLFLARSTLMRRHHRRFNSDRERYNTTSRS